MGQELVFLHVEVVHELVALEQPLHFLIHMILLRLSPVRRLLLVIRRQIILVVGSRPSQILVGYLHDGSHSLALCELSLSVGNGVFKEIFRHF